MVVGERPNHPLNLRSGTIPAGDHRDAPGRDKRHPPATVGRSHRYAYGVVTLPALTDPIDEIRAARSTLADLDTDTLTADGAQAVLRATAALDQLGAAHAALTAAKLNPTISVDQFAQVLGIHRATAYDHVKRGNVPTVRVGARVRIPSAYVLRQLAGEA